MNTGIVSYYSARAKEYEKVYSKPERQGDLLQAGQILQGIFSGKAVLEIACGTGYWTERIARTAHSIIATDINDTVIEVAQSKTYAPAVVTFQKADIFKLAEPDKYESLFGGFIWSHIPLQGLNRFFDITNSLVRSGGKIVFMDNHFVEGSSLPITDRDSSGNTYQTRKLEDGTTHKVIKNFPTEDFIRRLLKGKAQEITFINLTYYWILKYSCY